MGQICQPNISLLFSIHYLINWSTLQNPLVNTTFFFVLLCILVKESPRVVVKILSLVWLTNATPIIFWNILSKKRPTSKHLVMIIYLLPCVFGSKNYISWYDKSRMICICFILFWNKKCMMPPLLEVCSQFWKTFLCYP